MKTESERYAAQNGREFKISEEELCDFLGVSILMGINKLPTIKSYWSVNEGLGNSVIQTAMARGRFLEILENIHFADNHKELPPKDSDEYDCAWKLRPLFYHLEKHFLEALQPECHQSIDEHIYVQVQGEKHNETMKNKPIKCRFLYWFRCGTKSGYLYEFNMHVGKKGTTELGLGESVVLSLCQKQTYTLCVL